MRKPSTIRRAVATMLVMAVALTSLFASPLVPRNGFGDAKVYNSNYKIVPNAKEIAEGYVLMTSNDSVVLDNGDAHVEVDANTLAVFMDLAANIKIYVLDGRVQAVSKSGDFAVMTTVTTYNVKSGSSIYIITNDRNELGFISEGSAQVRNTITGASTEIGNGSFIDNSISSFKLEQTTVPAFWGSLAPEAREKAPLAVQPKAEAAEKAASSPLTNTFTYSGYKATLTAYKGYAVLSYPSFITDEEIEAAAEAACRAYPEYMDGIYYRIAESGKVEFSYPASYGKDEFNLACRLLSAELPAYIASLFPPEEQQVAALPETEKAAQESEQVAAEAKIGPVPEAETGKTPLETLPRPEQEQKETKTENDLRFGLSAGVIYGAGKDGDTFVQFPYTKGRVGMFWKDFVVFARPYIKFKDFTFGLNVDVPFVDAKIDTSAFKFDTTHGITGYINSVAKYISVIGYEKESFGFKAKLNTSLDIKSPIFKSNDWRYQGGQNLVGNLYFKAGSFSFDAFIDDLKLANRLEGRSQFAGFRAGFKFGKIDTGISVVADFGDALKESELYPSIDLNLPFNLSDSSFSFDVKGAAQITFVNGFKLNGYMGQAVLNIGYGAITMGFGGAYSKGVHFTELINNSPVTTEVFKSGTSVDAILTLKLDTKVFDLSTSFRLPFNLSTKGLVRNTVMTRSGSLEDLSADVFDIQMELSLGSFTFITGGSSYGFSGKVGDIFQALKDREDRKEAILSLIDPDTSTLFAELDFKTKIGSGDLDVFLRADLKAVESMLRVPMSIGASYTF